MIDLLKRCLHAAVFIVLALLGMLMALAFLFSTVIAIAVFYVIARLRGKPFGIRSYWNRRSQTYGFVSRPFGASYARAAAAASSGARARRSDVIDVELREVH